MSMGLEGAYGANEFQKALRQRILDNLAQEQQKFQNSMTVRGADRADRALSQQDELTRLKIEELKQNATTAAADKQFAIGKSLNETLAPDTVIPTSSPAAAPLRMIGALRTEQPTLPSTSTVGVMQAPTGSGVIAGRLVSQTKNEGNPLQFRKLPSAGQQNVIADNARADAAAAQSARLAAQNVPLVPVGPNGILTTHDDAIGQPTYKPPKDTSGADTNRMDKSFTYTDKQLTDLSKPLSDQAERIGRLRATINQMSPQADALIAPELLTAMAGGAGSGLRMNEAEISRVVGGRNQWQSLKAKLEAWQADPSQPFSVTPEQRTQMRSLVKAIADRGQQRLTDIGAARRALIDAPDVNTHRRIVQDVTDKLNASAIGADDTGPQKETWVRDPTSRKLVKSSGQ